MAEENDNSQEKTEEATPRRLEKAKEDGQTARSKELATMAVLLAGAGGLLMFGASLGASMEGIMRDSFVLERSAIFDTRHMSVQLIASAKEAAFALTPLLILLLVAAVAGSIGIGGLLVSGKAIAPKLNRMDPLKGLKRMFSMRSLIELVKAILKVGLVIAVAIFILNLRTDDLLSISEEPVRHGTCALDPGLELFHPRLRHHHHRADRRTFPDLRPPEKTAHDQAGGEG